GLVAESTPQAANRPGARAIWYSLAGKRNGRVVLEVRRSDGRLRELVLRRSTDFSETVPQRTTPRFQMLAGDVGYVDAVRLLRSDLEAVVQQQFGAAAIILDMRGYPGEAGLALAARIAASDQPSVGAIISWPLISPDRNAEAVVLRSRITPTGDTR